MADTTEVGTAYVAIIPSARGFARTLQKAIAKEFASSNLDKAIEAALAGTSVSVPVRPEIGDDIPDELPVRPGREPELPVRLDPLVAAFQAQIRKELSGLTDVAAAEIPVDADTDDLRSEIAAAIAQAEATLAAEVPTEPGDRREYERLLREQVDAVAERVRARVDTDVDVDVDEPLRERVDEAGEEIGKGLASRITSSLPGGFAGLGPLPLFAGLVTVGAAAGPLIAAAIAGGMLAGLGGGVIALGILGVKDDPRFKAAASSLTTTVKETLSKAAGPLLGTEDKPGPLLRAMETLEDLVVEIGPSLEQMFESIGPYIPGLAEGFASFVKEAMPGLLKAVDAAGPLLEVIALNLGPLGEDVGNFFSIIADLGPAAGDAINFIFFLVGVAINATAALLYILGATFSTFYDLAVDAKDNVENMWNFIKAVFTEGGASVKDKAEAMIGFVLRQVDKLTGGSKKAIDSTVGFFSGLPGRITGAVGNLGNLLFDAGRKVVTSLINGIKSMFGSLGDTAGSMAGIIRNYLPFSPAKEGPLSGRGNPFYSGQSIVDLLASGITGNLGTARAAAGSLAETLALSGSPLTTAPAGAYALASTATPAPGALRVEWVGGGDPIVRGIRESVRIYYGGDPDAAFGS